MSSQLFTIAAVVAILTFGATSAQVFQIGSCPTASAISNFNVSQYTGLWYENQKYFAIFELGQTCVTANYTLNSDGTVKVFNQGKQFSTGKVVSATGSAKLVSPPSGALLVSFSSIFNVLSTGSRANYLVLATDYTSYSVVWSCSSLLGVGNTQYAWILTRQQSPNSTVVDTARNVLSTNKISLTPLRTTSQSNC